MATVTILRQGLGMLFGSHLAGLAVAKTGVHIAHAITMAIGEKVHADAGFKVAGPHRHV